MLNSHVSELKDKSKTFNLGRFEGSLWRWYQNDCCQGTTLSIMETTLDQVMTPSSGYERGQDKQVWKFDETFLGKIHSSDYMQASTALGMEVL